MAAVTTIADLNALFNLIYEDVLFVSRDMNLMQPLVTNFEARSGYADRKVGKWNSATVMEVAEGVDFVTNTKFSESLEATFTPTLKMAQFLITDQMIETAESRQGVVNAAGMELGMEMAEYKDKQLLAQFANFGNSVGSAGSPVTLGIAAAAHTQIRKDNAKGQANFVWDPAHWYDLWTLLGTPAATFTFQGEIANQALRDYYVSNWLGTRHFVTNNITVDANDDAVSGCFVRSALGFDPRKALEYEPQRDASRNATEYNVREGYAVGVIRDEHGCKITADATEPTS